jgi:hypothetical protein
VYHQQPLNLKKVGNSGFYPIAPEKAESARKRFAVPALVHGNCRPMTQADIEGVVKLLHNTSSQFTFDVVSTAEIARHLFLPRDGVYASVIPSPRGPRGLFSFYVMNWKAVEPRKMDLNVAYVFDVAATGAQMQSLVADLRYKAANDAHADLVIALSVTGIHDALVANRFEAGAKALQFYAYNFRVPPMNESQMRFLFVSTGRTHVLLMISL